MRTKPVKAMALSLLLLCICLSADIAYGMGGGGHHGDGRPDFSSGHSGGSDGAPDPRATSGREDSSNWTDGWMLVMASDLVLQEPVSIPEPITALLLGLGIVGLVSTKGKFRK